MPVTELALLRILPSSTGNKPGLSPTLLSHLRLAKDGMEKASGFKFYYLHCIEDPSLIFILGGWPSVQFHMDEWIPSQENQDSLKMMEGEVDVEWMFHLDLDPNEREGVLDGKVIAVVRHFVNDGEREAFGRCFGEVKGNLEGYVGGESKVRGGWRVDSGFVKGDEPGKVKEGEEWVLFTGWESVEKHSEFAKTEGFQEYSKIRGHIDGADIKHGAVMEV